MNQENLPKAKITLDEVINQSLNIESYAFISVCGDRFIFWNNFYFRISVVQYYFWR